ncbi:MAG: hypothetical protein ACTSVD_00475 [Candidatus Thorarchaeota archaeon]|nr:MAG: hypothetical protein DRO73_02075 [Candidatus Thorarchaeota archaeon]
MSERDVSDDLVEPIYATAFFSVAQTGEVHEILTFEYSDPEGYYARVLADDTLFEAEVSKVWSNMQYFLDKERVEINGERVRAIINHVDIMARGAKTVATVFVIDFAGRFMRGTNRIETWIEEEEAPYDFDIIWRFPVGSKVLEVDTQLDYDILGDIIVLFAERGQRVGGYERITFEMPVVPFDTRTEVTRIAPDE